MCAGPGIVISVYPLRSHFCASVSEKWTTTAFGKRVCGAVSVHEWRQAKAGAGKSET